MQAGQSSSSPLPEIPREQWTKHPNYPNQVLLLGSHENFRRVSAHLVNHAWKAWGESPKRAPSSALYQLFQRWKAAMGGHEHYEEGKLYPFLEKRYQTSMAKLESDHRALHELEEKVHLAYKKADALYFATALKEHDQLLVEHLDREEEAVIPLLLSLSPDEFVRFTN